jgi:dipeptidyl aminopeptidase/acylaminoacyl peptidase
MTLDEAAKLIPAVDEPGITQTNEKEPAVVVFTSPSKPTTEEVQPKQDVELTGGLFASLADLALIDVETGAIKHIVRDAKARWFSLSPDGTHVGLTTIKGWEANSQQLVYDLQVYSLREQRTWVAARQVKQMYGINVSWSPNGDVLSYLTHGSRAAGECFVVPITGGEPRRCASGSHPSLADYFRAPLWDEKGKVLYFIGDGALWKIVLSTGMAREVAKIPKRKITEIVAPQGGGRFWSPDGGRSLVVTTRDDETKQAGFYRIDLETGQASRLLEGNRDYGWLFSFDVSGDGSDLVYRAEDAQHPGDIWITRADFRKPRRVTNVAPLFDDYEMGTSRLIEWMGVDGQPLRGALLLPAGYQQGTRYPLIVHVYGGSTGSDLVNQFGFFGYLASANMQVLATRGYAILSPDAPQRVGTPLRDVANTVLPGVNKVIELGIADPDRLAVMGQSYGSYSTLALLVQTSRFKAAVINAVVPSNLLVGYLRMSSDSSAGTGYYEEGQGGMGGTPWQYRDRYIENSPVYYFDKVETPLLMAHGTMDGNPVEFPNHTFAALRRLGKKVQYVLYGGEGHVIIGPANTIDFWNRRIAWLEAHLGKPSAPEQ